MPHAGLIADTILFLGGANLPGRALSIAYPVSQWLDEITIAPVAETVLGKITAGTDTEKKTRRAIFLILYALNGYQWVQARDAAMSYANTELNNALGRTVLDAERISLPRRFGPDLLSLQATPATFLAANRIRTGSGSLTTSGASPFEMSWHSMSKSYSFDAPNNAVDRLHAVVPGCYNIATTKFSTIGNLAQINGAVVQGNLGFTTQLSGCSILYSVNGGNLVVAHVWPDQPALVRNGLPPALAPHAADPVGVLLTLRMAHEGDLANPVGGGTFGIYGMVGSVPDTAQRALGPNNIRTHGYVDTQGNAYFVAVLVAGNWQLFGQQCISAQPAAGVSACLQLYP